MRSIPTTEEPIARRYLSLAELRVLRAVDDKPGVIASVLSRTSGYDEQSVEISLRVLERHGLVRATTIQRTGAVSWRITWAGGEQLIATPPPRLFARPRNLSQLEMFGRRR